MWTQACDVIQWMGRSVPNCHIGPLHGRRASPSVDMEIGGPCIAVATDADGCLLLLLLRVLEEEVLSDRRQDENADRI